MADEKEQLDNSILGTAKIDPSEYNALQGKTDRLSSMKYAIAGLIYMFRRENSTKVLVVATVVAFGLLVWLQVEVMAGLIVVLSLTIVWMAEIINSAIEAVVDMATDEIHPMAKVAKDVASTATLISGIVFIITMAVVFGPSLLEYL